MTKRGTRPWPNGRHERALRKAGVQQIAGVDEAGAGALAGPVVAAAVCLPWGHGLPVRDSKCLSPKARERLYEEICAIADWAVGIVEAPEIDVMGIRQANYEAMRLAIEGLPRLPEHVLVDAYRLPGVKIAQTPIVRGDQQEYVIAAASIVAKVTRDRILLQLDAQDPRYGFAQHKGYGTQAHRAALRDLGASPHHRSSFSWS